MAKTIHQMLKPLPVNERFISQTLAHDQETDDVIDWLGEEHQRSYAHDKPFMPFVNG